MRPCCAYVAELCLEWKMFRTKEKNQNTLLCSLYIYFFENLVAYEITWENTVEPDRPYDSIIQRMRIACWTPEATSTHSEYVILIAFPQQLLFRERTWMSCLYVHCLCCYFCDVLISMVMNLRDGANSAGKGCSRWRVVFGYPINCLINAGHIFILGIWLPRVTFIEWAL